MQGEFSLIDGVKKLYPLEHKILHNKSDFSLWNFDGSTADQDPGGQSELILEPAQIYLDSSKHKTTLFIMFDMYKIGPDGNELLRTNVFYTRVNLIKKAEGLQVWTGLGLEQEYFLINPKTNKLLAEGLRCKQAPYSYGVGFECVFGRDIVKGHYRSCSFSSIKRYVPNIYAGIDGEFCSGHWEDHIGRAVGIELYDLVRTSCHILEGPAKVIRLIVNLDTKQLNGDWDAKPVIQECAYGKCILPATTKPESKRAGDIDIYHDGAAEHFIEEQETRDVNVLKYGGVRDRRARLVKSAFEKRFKIWIIHLIWWLVLHVIVQIPVTLANEFNCVCGKPPSASTVAAVAIIIAIIGAVAQVIVAIINKKL